MMTPKLSLDPITLEVVRNSLIAMVNEMQENLVRTAYSPLAAEVKDFSVSLVDAEGNAIAQARNGLPIFVADLGTTVRAGLAAFADEGFQPGDVIMANDAKTNGQHLNNIAIYTPLFVDGELFAFPAIRSHWIDVGGNVPGSISLTREVFAEGIQFPSLKVYRAGVPDQGILRLIRANTRFPELNMGDMRAQISACRLGERRLAELVSRYGKAVITACVQRIWDDAEALSRDAVAAIPDGEYSAECFLDDDGIDIGRAIPLKVKVIVAGSEMTMDYSEMPPQTVGPYNSRGGGGAETVSRVAFKYLTCPLAPISEGAFRNLSYTVPEGTIISADETAGIGRWSTTIVSTIDLIIKALHPAIPERVKAGDLDNIGSGNFSGQDPRHDRRFLTFMPVLGGWGAKHDRDGLSAVVSLVQGDVHYLPAEVQEHLYPLRVREIALRADSGGPGRQRGGLGTRVVHEALADCEYRAYYDRTLDPPWGLAGGRPGKVTRTTVWAGEEKELPAKCQGYGLAAGHIVTLRSGAGGGYGPPWERDIAAVRDDVLDGYVSSQAAGADYGVVFEAGSLEVDLQATEALRARMKSSGA